MPVSEKFVQALKMMREKKGTDLSPEEIAQAHSMMPPEPDVAPNAFLRGVDKIADYHPMAQGFGAVMDLRDKALNALAEKFPTTAHNLDAVMGAPTRAANWALEKTGVEHPEDIRFSKYLPNTSRVLHSDISAGDILSLAAFEGLGRGSSSLKAAGERGKITAFENGKPALPPNATKEMAQAILEQNPSVSNDAGKVISGTISSLEERGRGASQAAKNISDTVGNQLSPESITQLHEFFPEHPVIKELYDRLDPSKVYARGNLQSPANLSAYEPFSYASRNTHKAWQLDPITKQPIAKNPAFGEMMRGVRKDLRSNTTPLTEGQLQEMKTFNPEFSGTTAGEAIEELNGVTRKTILDQKRLSGIGKERKPLSYMNSVHTNLDENAFAKNSGLNDLLEYANKYGASKEHAEALQKYAKDNTNGGPGFNPDLLALHSLIAGPKSALVLEAGKAITNPAKSAWLMEKAGGLGEKLKPSAYLNLKPTLTGE